MTLLPAPQEHPVTAPQIDLTSLGFWSKSFRERDESFAWLREQAPVSWHLPMERPHFRTDHGETGFWALVKNADIQFVSQNHELFSSSSEHWRGITFVPKGVELAGPPTFLDMDPPDHTRYRQMMSRAFTPKAVARLRAKINERAEQIVDRVVGMGEFDFVREVSAKLPMMTIADMVGVPESLVHSFADAGDMFTSAADPTIRPEGVDAITFMMQQMETLASIGIDLVTFRRENPADDVATALANFDNDGVPLSDQEITQFMVLLSVAGNDTTKQTTSHSVVSLWRNPDQRTWLSEDYENRIGQSLEEFVRHASPVMDFARTATQDLELRGTQINRGDKVVMFYPSGNRDEEIFPDPHRFDLQRDTQGHVGFGGGGVHFCLGNGVAKAQLRALFGQILTKLPHLEVGEPQALLSDFINGVSRLPVRA